MVQVVRLSYINRRRQNLTITDPCCLSYFEKLENIEISETIHYVP